MLQATLLQPSTFYVNYCAEYDGGFTFQYNSPQALYILSPCIRLTLTPILFESCDTIISIKETPRKKSCFMLKV